MVNGNLGTGVAVMGAFSLVRFRSVPGKAREIVCLFLSMTAGLACAAGYVAVAILFTAILCVGMIVVSLIPVRVERKQELHITVPESLSYSDAFDDLFATYLKKETLVSVTSPTSTPVKNRYPARDFSVKCRKGQGFRRPYATVPLAHTKSH